MRHARKPRSPGRCTMCSQEGATIERLDAGKTVHWFHRTCWKRFQEWLSEPLPVSNWQKESER